MKSKFLPSLLIFVIIISGFFIFQLYSDKQSLISTVQELNNEKDGLIEENTTLKHKISDYKNRNESLAARLTEISNTLNSIQAERNNLQEEVSTLQEENQELQRQLSSLKNRANRREEGTLVSASAAAKTSDKYWQDILKERAELKLKINDLNKKLNDLMLKVSQLKDDKSKLKIEIEHLQKEKVEWESKLEFSKRTIDLLTKQLVRERERSRKVLEEYDALRKDNFNLRSNLNLANAQKEELLSKLKDIDEKKALLEDKIKSIEAILKEKSMELESLQGELSSVVSSAKAISPAKKNEQAVKLPPIVVNVSPSARDNTSAATISSDSSSSTKSGVSAKKSSNLSAKIIAVNQKDRFVIIDAGRNAGLKVGDKFSVVRNGRKIGNISVIETRPNISACDIDSGSDFKEGDTANLLR